MCSHAADGDIDASGLICTAVRRYDVLVKVHAEMYLNGESETNKQMLTKILVEKTFDDLAAICKNLNLRETTSKYLYAYTDKVIRECHSNRTVSTEALPRVGFYYLFGLHLLPGRWMTELKKLETICYRDVACVYDRYIAVKTAMANVFASISSYVLHVLFGRGIEK
jgi:hypothetical protein